ncbi:hypothetical protein [Chitinibacter sp. ZOR0017]|uniref:FimV/HubP-related protein n=1 Tax=Chitinibacter sp. ZOR0017 TaxID=1339254 RepID=UPI000648DA5B|nr:hypothetical protein [Chitinibacter sp. ZOR0017]
MPYAIHAYLPMRTPTPGFARRLSVSLALIGLLTPAAHALTLGDLELQSYVGQPFRGAVSYKVSPGEQLHLDCLTLTQPTNDLPGLPAPQVNVIARGESQGIIQISTHQLIGEPTVAFGLRVECNGMQLSRAFTAFLNVAPQVEPSTAQARAPQMPRSERSFKPVNPAPAELPSRDPQTLISKKPTTLAELTKRYYPIGTPQYPRYLNKLISANPQFGADTPIAAGTPVLIPDKLRSTRKTAPPVAKMETGQLRLDGAEPLAPAKTKPVSGAEYTRELEQRVAQLTELQGKMQLEITQLNQRLAQINPTSASPAPLMASAPANATASLAASNAETIASASTSVAATTTNSATSAPQVASAVRHTEAPAQDTGFWLWGGFGLAALALAGVAGLKWQRRRQESQTNWHDDNLSQHMASQYQVRPVAGLQSEALSRHTMLSMLHPGGTPNAHGIEVQEELENDLAKAQLLIAKGETLEAIDLLYRLIDEDPSDIERWLMLFRLFRQQGMKTEYAQLAQNLRAISPDDADWELVRNIGAKLDPENPLYIRLPDAQPDPRQALKQLGGMGAAIAAAQSAASAHQESAELDLDLRAPMSPEASLMSTMAEAVQAIPPQYGSLLKPEFTPSPAEHKVDLPPLQPSEAPQDLSPLEIQLADYQIEEVSVEPIVEVDKLPEDQPYGGESIDFELSPPDLPSADKKA